MGVRGTSTLLSTMLALLVFPAGVYPQVAGSAGTSLRPVPEMKRLFETFGGDWDTTEKREKTQFFPEGGERRGRSYVRLGAGGATLVMEGHSDGSAGPLSYTIVVWWDKQESRYGYFTCFKDETSGCEVRGTAQWEGDKFVNDYEEAIKGKRFKFRDTFENITATSHTLVFAWVKDDGSTMPVIVSTAVRRRAAND